MKFKTGTILAFVAGLLLLLHFALSSLAIFAKSPTFDESVHLAGGYTFWTLDDYRINPENGNFPQRWAALPLLFRSDIKVPLDSSHWLEAKEWFFSFFFLFKSGNDPDSLFIPAKFMMLILSLALCVAVFLISREIFGGRGALISLCLCALSPTVLSQSSLVTSDLAAALFFLLSSYFIWRNFRTVNISNTLFCSASLALLFLSKMSAPIIIPFYLLAIFARLRSAEPTICEFRGGRTVLDGQGGRIKALAPLILVHIFAVYIAIWASFGFRYTQVPPGSPSAAAVALQWDDLAKGEKDTLDNAIIATDKFGLLPRGYLHGFLYVKKHLGKRISFMDGEKSNKGFAFFFPYCFVIKTPIPVMVLCAASIFLLLRLSNSKSELAHLAHLAGLAPLAIFAGLFAIFAVSSGINIGHRHLLPLYPMLFILCGVLGDARATGRSRWIKALAGVCAVCLAFESVAIAPHHIAYFNQFAGGPRNGYKLLVDSSLDWGQDLKELKKVTDRMSVSGKSNLYLAYFGTASINSYGLEGFISLPGYFTQENFRIHDYGSGTYCVSATMLHLLYYQDIFASLKFPPEILFDDSFDKLQPFVSDMLAAAGKGDEALAAFFRENGEEFCLRRYRAYDLIRFARLCEYLKRRMPDGNAGHSILIYKLDRAEIDTAMRMKVSF